MGKIKSRKDDDKMGKNKNKGINSDSEKQKTQELEQTTRISKGFNKNNPQKSK